MGRNYYRLPLTFTSAENTVDSSDWLEIVQPEWAAADEAGFAAWLTRTGKSLPQTGGIRYIEALFTLLSQYKSSCNDTSGLEVELQIHRSRPELLYRLVASYGSLSNQFIHETTVTETIDIEMEESVTVNRAIIDTLGPETMAWDGQVYDQYGNELNALPPISRTGSTYNWGVKLVGTLRVTYTERHDAYILTIPPRPAGDYDPERLESAYESTVRAFWGDGQLTTHEVDLPQLIGNCRGGGSVHGGSGDDEEKCVRHVIVVDPCNEDEIVEEFDEPMECPEEEEAEPTEPAEGGTTP